MEKKTTTLPASYSSGEIKNFSNPKKALVTVTQTSREKNTLRTETENLLI